MKKSKSKGVNVLPNKIKTIIVIDIILSIILLFLGISFFVASSEISSNIDKSVESFMKEAAKYPNINLTKIDAKEYLLTIVAISPYIGTFLIVLSIIHIILSVYLWKRKSWARTVQIILALFFIGYSLFTLSIGSIILNILIILVEGWIASYLLFTPEGKTSLA